jgi:hypothetical protein
MQHVIKRLKLIRSSYARLALSEDYPDADFMVKAAEYTKALSILNGYGAEPTAEQTADTQATEMHDDPRYLRLLILTLKAALTGATGSCVAVDCAVDAASDAYDDLFHSND